MSKKSQTFSPQKADFLTSLTHHCLKRPALEDLTWGVCSSQGKKEDKKLLRKERGREGWLMLIVKSNRLRNPGDPWYTFCMGPSLMQVEQEASCCGLRGTLKSASSAVTTPLAGPNLLLEIQTVSMLPLCVGLSPSAFCCPHLRLTPQSYVNN